MGAPVGSSRWLLAHELRLAWRGTGGKRLWVLLLGGGFIWACIHLAAWGVLRFLAAAPAGTVPPQATIIGGAAFWLLASIMLSQTMVHSVAALFDRGDLDLLLSSPLSAQAIFLVRGLGIGLIACLLPLLLLLPFAHAGVVVGRPGLLAIYPVIVALALACAAVGMGSMMLLVKTLGARRAKTAAQIFAALVGAGFFLLSQVQQILPKSWREAIVAWTREAIQPAGILGPDSLLWLPARAMLGETLPLLMTVAIGAGLFALVVHFTYRRFVAGSQEAVSGGRTRAAVVRRGALRFHTGLRAVVMLKEWRLILRDPQVISQTLLQILYLIPMMFIGFRADKTWLIVPGVVMIVSMLAGNLAWLTIAAEDAPELIGTSPVPIARIRWIKAAAAVLPILTLLLPLALWWAPRDPYAAFVLLFCCAGGMASAAICQIWNPRAGDRRNMKQRYKQSGLLNLLEAFGSFGWAGTAMCMSGFWWFLPLALAVAALGPGSAWLLGRKARAGGALA